MHYISRGRRPPRQTTLSVSFDENLRFVGTRKGLLKLSLSALVGAAVVYVYTLLLLVAFG